MSHVSNRLHLVWCPKYRRSVLVGPVAEELSRLVEQQCRALGVEVIALAVQPDHVHLIVALPAQVSVSKLANQVKGASSFFLRRQFPALCYQVKATALWARGYFSCSVGSRAQAAVRRYVEQQS